MGARMSKVQKQTIALFSLILTVIGLLFTGGMILVGRGVMDGEVSKDIEHLHETDAAQQEAIEALGVEQVEIVEAFKRFLRKRSFPLEV